MKFYCINLDKAVDRMAHMRQECAARGIDFERISAVYGKDLSQEDLRRDYDEKRSFIALKGHRMTASEIGIALSHIKVCRQMIQENVPVAIVLEDDVSISPQFADAVARVEAVIDLARPQIYHFSQTYNPPRSDLLPPEIRRVKSMCAAAAYCLTLPAARAIVRANYPVITVADCFRRWRKWFGVELYRVFPTTVTQDYETFITDNTFVCQRPVRGLRRWLLMLLDMWLRLRTGR